MELLAWLIPAVPLAAALLIGIGGYRWREGGGHLAAAASLISFALAVPVIVRALESEEPLTSKLTWFVGGTMPFEVGVYVDGLTALMLFVVTFVGTVVVFYSIGYMAEEGRRKPRYYAEISLFIGAMLGLVLADNYLIMYVFWEGVGLCSYLLISFWHHKPEAASAGLKAFLVTRFGDLFFLTGILLLLISFGSLDFETLFSMEIPQEQSGLMMLATLLVFGGAVGKSAQFPLHVWLPDAMEGPTTVSALIHAATMVNAGVYLVARSFPLMVQFPATVLTVAAIGGFTALFTATMALVNNDIKRVLAFSTVSQLGYMMLGLGAGGYAVTVGLEAGGYTAGMFHLMNHGIFKALLFLCAGSVMHALGGATDLRKMGGLRAHLPVTSTTMFIGALAIAGIPPLSGFWSKDAVLEAAFSGGEHNPLLLALWAFGVLTVLLTAFYMFRLYFMAFGGRARYGDEVHPHESPRIMTVPLIILAVLAVFSGFAAFDIGRYVSFGERHLVSAGELLTEVFTNPLTYLSTLLALIGMGFAYAVYHRGWVDLGRYSTAPGRFIHRLLTRRYYLNELYTQGISMGVGYGFSLVLDLFDRYVVDGLVNLVGWGSKSGGETVRRAATGSVATYATWVVAGLVILLAVYAVRGWAGR